MRFERIDAANGDNGDGFFSDVHSAAACAMAEILVSEMCARRLSAAGVLFEGR